MFHDAEFFYVRRTLKHIQRVHRYALLLVRKLEWRADLGWERDLIESVASHDAAKFSEEEWGPTQRYWTELSQEERDELGEYEAYEPAWEHHLKHCLHHPGHWRIHKRNESMTTAAVLEMVADWAAMAEEKTGGDGRQWAQELKAWAEKALDAEGLGEHRDLILDAVGVIQDFWLSEM